MYGYESLDELEEAIPKFDNVSSSTWWRLFLEVFFKRAFVGIFKENVVAISMYITAMKSYNTLRMP